MKRGDWIIALAFIITGLACLVISISFVNHSESVHAAMVSFVKYCLWLGVPLTLFGILYLLTRSKKKNRT